MKHIRCSRAAVLIAGIAGLGWTQAQAAETPIGAPQDWSSQTVITRKPMTPDELVAAGRGADIAKLYRDPRYVAAVLRRIESETPRISALAKGASTTQASRTRDRTRPQPGGGNPSDDSDAVERDWSFNLGATAGGKPGVFPAKYNFDIFAAPSCANDFVVYTTNAASSASQASIASFNQLYQGTCNGPWNNNGAIKAPNVMWAYNTGAGQITETSPVLSYLDGGKQVAYVQRNTTNGSLQLVLLKWQAGQGTPTAPVTLVASATAAAYRSCASGCYFAIPFFGTSNSGNTPTYSAPFVDYFGDVLWAGDGNGNLHKFTGVFQGQPQEVTTGGFPKTVEAGLNLSPPSYDFNGFVFVGSQSGATSGGKLYRINASNGNIVASSASLALANTSGLREAPIIDLRNGSVYVFTFNDNTTTYTDTTRCAPFGTELNGCRAIFRFDRLFADNTSGTRAWIGRGNSTTRALYRGGFDDAFYASNNGTGNLYVVGGRPDNTFYATLWKVPINAGALGSTVRGPEFGAHDRYETDGVTTNNQNLSPVTVIKNPHTGFEYVYVSTASYANDLGCGSSSYASACLYMYALNQTVPPVAGTSETWRYNISSNIGTGISGSGTFTVNATSVLTAGTDFVVTGGRSADRTALVNAIQAASGTTGYTAATSGGCNGFSGNCLFDVTRTAHGDVPDTDVATTGFSGGLTRTSNTSGTADVAGGIVDVTFSPSVNPGAALQVVRGTGGIIVDNVRPDAELGTSQVYFAQIGTPATALIPGTPAAWTTTFGNVDTSSNNRTYTVNGRTFTGNGSANNCPTSGNGTFDVRGTTADNDAAQLRACLSAANLTGFAISGSTNQVIVTSTTNGSKASTLVVENISNTNTTFADGTADTPANPSTGNAIQASQSGLL